LAIEEGTKDGKKKEGSKEGSKKERRKEEKKEGYTANWFIELASVAVKEQLWVRLPDETG